jgi:signal transduction histidine kinase/ligand-binding sensor domain-containing protein
MPKPLNYLWLIAGIIFTGVSRGQKIFFEQLTTAEGLPSDYVNCIFEDSRGILWIGTDKGACTYDGLQFQNFSNDNGLSSNFISCFAEAPSGNIWIGTVDAGICFYNGKKISRFLVAGFENAGIIDIHFNSDSSFFIVTKQADLYYFHNTTSVPRLFKNFSFLRTIGHNRFLTGISGQLYILEKKGESLELQPQPYPEEKGNLFAWLSDSNLVALRDNVINNYVIKGQSWYLENKFTVTGITDWTNFKNVFINNIDKKSNDKKLSWSDIKKIFINNNELFIATSGGLFYVDKANNQYHFTDENGLGTNFLKSLYKDRSNTIYLCTYGGGVKIWPDGYLSEFKLNGKVTSIFPTGNDALITTNKSVYRYSGQDKKITGYFIPAISNFTSIYKGKNKDIFIGTLNNFYKLPSGGLQINSLSFINKKHIYPANTGISGFAMQKENMLISSYGDGIYLFNGSIIDTLTVHSTLKAPYIIESLVPLGSSVAALTYNSGLTIYDSVNRPISLNSRHGLLSNTVYSAFRENEKLIWIGTKNGLNLFDGNRIIKTYSTPEGLIGSKVVCIFRDNRARLWILSDSYLHLVEGDKLRPVRSHPLLFHEKNSINRAAYNKENNLLFIGLTDALLTVDINKIVPDTGVIIPKLAAVTIDSNPLSLIAAENITFSKPVSDLTFRFAGLHHTFRRKSDIYYKLNGFEDDWKLLPSNNEVVYNNLAAGNYELMAKTINPDGYSSRETSLLVFEMLPPIWKRVWFVALMAIVLLSIFFYIGSIRSRKRYNRKLKHLQEEYRLQLERERIARELHDNVGSQLTYLINKIEDDYPKLAEKNEAEKLSSFARGAMQELRETIWALDKKEVQWDDMENKIRQLIHLYKNDNHNIKLDWNINAEQLPALKPLEALNIYRVIQEALTNAEKYSVADEVVVSVHPHRIEINDNGKGFLIPHTDKGYGLKNMEKRAEEMNGKLEIESKPGTGTIVRLLFP